MPFGLSNENHLTLPAPPVTITSVGTTRPLWIVICAALLGLTGFAGRSASNETNNDFRFSILGDRTGDAEPQIYESVWRDVGVLHPDFVINVGDSIQGGNDATAEAEWRARPPVWDPSQLPQFFTPG